MKIIRSRVFDEMVAENVQLKVVNKELREELSGYKDDSTITEAKRISSILKAFGIKEHSVRFLEIAERCALELLGRDNDMIRKYSQTAFLKDVDENIVQRAIALGRQDSIITKQIEGKRKRK